MKIYVIDYTDEALEGINHFTYSGEKQVLKKLQILINELKTHPRTGEGKPKRITFRGKKY